MWYVEMVLIKMQRAAASPYSRYRMKANLHLPFNGTWFVLWGGRSLADNRHAVVLDQRFAYDFVIVNNGKTHENEGKHNNDYYCWGQVIRAPACGVVVSTEAFVPDNLLGATNSEHPLGNYVILNHGFGEYSFLVHLQCGTVRVQPGQKVCRGEIIGSCGNSGFSTQPHLHFHVQSSPYFQNGFGYPAPFYCFYANCRFVPKGIPRRGSYINSGE